VVVLPDEEGEICDVHLLKFQEVANDIGNLQKKINGVKSNNQDQWQRYGEEIRNELESLRSRLQQVEDGYSELDKQNARLEEAMKNLLDKVANMENFLQDISTDIKSLSSELIEHRTKSNMKDVEMEKEINRNQYDNIKNFLKSETGVTTLLLLLIVLMLLGIEPTSIMEMIRKIFG